MIKRKNRSIVLISPHPSPQTVFTYLFTSDDFSKLPTDTGTGSIAIEQDTGKTYIFHEDNGWKEWR